MGVSTSFRHLLTNFTTNSVRRHACKVASNKGTDEHLAVYYKRGSTDVTPTTRMEPYKRNDCWTVWATSSLFLSKESTQEFLMLIKSKIRYETWAFVKLDSSFLPSRAQLPFVYITTRNEADQ